jgi:3-oxoadipate enol-lactonase
MRLPFYEHSGLKLHYIDVDRREDPARGLPLLLVHGAGSSHLTWALTIQEMSTTNRVLAVDLSGHGRSDPNSAPASISDMYAEEVASLVVHLGLDDFVLVGHSLGGAVAMCYALKEDLPRPSGLVLADTSCTLDLSRVLVGLVKEAVDDRRSPLSLDDNPDAATIRRHEEQVMISNPGIMQRDLAAVAGFDISDRVAGITIPTFVVVGEKDDVINPKDAARLRDLLPRADLALVKGARHVPMLEAPSEFNRLLRKFVEWVEQEFPA